MTAKDNYGQKDGEKVAVVKEVYNELKLDAAYQEFEQKSFDEIRSKIDSVRRTD